MLVGVAGVIAVAWLLASFLHTGAISFASNAQIVSRVSPSTIDLAVALASGAAGAFAISRSDVANSLPGVAISIALVPPLSIVGIGLSDGEWRVAFGAMLLFLTNFLSILLAGGGLFALLGLSVAATEGMVGGARRRAFTAVTIGILIVTIPLATTSYRVAREALAELHTRRLARQWLRETGFEVSKIEADGNRIDVLITGHGEPPLLSELGSKLKSDFDPSIEVRLIVIPSRNLVYPEQDTD